MSLGEFLFYFFKDTACCHLPWSEPAIVVWVRDGPIGPLDGMHSGQILLQVVRSLVLIASLSADIHEVHLLAREGELNVSHFQLLILGARPHQTLENVRLFNLPLVLLVLLA